MKEIECNNTEEIVCPWCGYEHGDSWEYTHDDGEIECGSCDKPFSWVRNVQVDYSSDRQKCKEKCTYGLDKDRIENPYIYENHNWTIWKCTVCHHGETRLGDIAKDDKPYVQAIDTPSVEYKKL